MSGHSFSLSCPNCDGSMSAYSDYKPFQYESGECYDCGFHYFTVAEQRDLKSLNECRADEELHGQKLKPIKKLPKIQDYLKPYIKGGE